jgi:hypothetical protein
VAVMDWVLEQRGVISISARSRTTSRLEAFGREARLSSRERDPPKSTAVEESRDSAVITGRETRGLCRDWAALIN